MTEPERTVPEPLVRFLVDSLPAALREQARAWLASQGHPLDDAGPSSDRPTIRVPPALETPRPGPPRRGRLGR